MIFVKANYELFVNANMTHVELPFILLTVIWGVDDKANVRNSIISIYYLSLLQCIVFVFAMDNLFHHFKNVFW